MIPVNIPDLQKNQTLALLQGVYKRVDMLQLQLLQIVIFQEYLMQKLSNWKDTDGNPLFREEEFAKFYDNRVAEIQQEAQAYAQQAGESSIDLGE